MTIHKRAIYLTNTATGSKERFIPAQPHQVNLYVCGVTPYDHAHLGHGRCYVNFDVIHRTFLFLGYDVNYVRNITDVDDKIVKKAQAVSDGSGSLQERARTIAQTFTHAFQSDMTALHVALPTNQPKVSEHITDIIAFIEGLICAGHAYEQGGDVYFSVDSFTQYGQLSRKPLDELEAGARVDVNSAKRNPADFVLWKGGVAGSFWQSPWGEGRPGWHIECSTFAQEYLGGAIDIHGGGQDLIFPHHENEKAQSEALNKNQFARYWVHNAHVNVAKQKMSKSLGNFLTLKDLFAQHDPMVLRLYLLQHHYATPIDFMPEHLESVSRAYRRLARALSQGQESEQDLFEQAPNLLVDDWLAARKGDSLAEVMLEALCDDFNTPKLLGYIFGMLDELAKDRQRAIWVRDFLQQALGLSCQLPQEIEQEVTPEMQRLIELRAQARAEKNWAEADRLRDELAALGYTPRDGKA